jgi:hypothetical protein
MSVRIGKALLKISNIEAEERKQNSNNRSLKKFEKEMIKYVNQFTELWQLNCHNFKNKPIKENICKYCLLIKSERAYHCRHCRKCVKRLDHHCYFLNNCIGYSNYKLFLTMLLYCIITSTILIIALVDVFRIIFPFYTVTVGLI